MMDLMEMVGIAAIAVIVLIVILVVAFEKGWVWLSQERIDKIHAKGDALQAKLEAKLAKKAKPAAAPAKSKAERIAEAQALLSTGVITQADFDAAKAKILAD
jgi:hypothetical protein